MNDGFSRRGFLKGLLGGAALAACWTGLPVRAQTPPGRKVSPAEKARRVLVLGAGMSGLTAALALKRRGHDVTVIEYQSRIGGRLLSLPLAGGQVTEAGGGHFRANMPYVLGYIRRFNLPLLSLNDGLPRYFFNGKAADAARVDTWPWDLTREERNVTVSTTLNRYLYLNGLDTDSVLSTNWPDSEALEMLDNLTLGQLIGRVGASPAFLKLLDAHGGTFTSSSPALGVIPDLAYHFGDQNLYRIRGGNDQLPQAMAREMGEETFVLDAPVVRIEQTGTGATVTVKDGREFRGDAVICTIPFTVLQQVEVIPGWSERKKAMLEGFEWDKTVKVIAQTRTPSWLTKGVHGWPMAGSDRPWERVIDITGNEPGGHGNTFFYLNGTNADRLLGSPRKTRAQEVVDLFRQDLPDLFDDVLTVKDFAWSEQPWIRASFGGQPLGGGWMLEECRRPEGVIHFAGDFTTLKTGWVEGAIESGLRAARQVDPGAEGEVEPVIREEQLIHRRVK